MIPTDTPKGQALLRFQNAQDVTRAIDAKAVSSISEAPMPQPEDTEKPSSLQQIPDKKHITPIAISAGIVVVILILASIYLYMNKHTSESMVYIPAGWFWMGCSPNDSNCGDDEKPYHKVYLSAYFIDKNDVTVDEYTRCVNAGGCTQPITGQYCNWGVSGRGDHPINCVDWNQANTYCQWRGKELPTEAQWEKAARGTNGRIYPWGNEWDASKACFNQSSTCAVGSYPSGASPYGVMDMAGNVWDWCRDWYDANYYASSPDHNPTGPDSGRYRVFRGHLSWITDYPPFGRASRRGGDAPYVPSHGGLNNGFRCIRQASK